MKVAYRTDLRMSDANRERLMHINCIIEEYSAAGYRLTLRQLYYQLVSRAIIPNKSEEYAKLSVLLGKGRMAGYIDWDAIEDRIRVPKIPYYANSVSDAISDIVRQYRRNRMEGQDNYIEVWVEKDALSGVLSPITSKYHIRLMVNRGYSSITAMHDAAIRFENVDAAPNILYLGDHDPSGIDMIRDIRERLHEFGVDARVHRVALTDAQVRDYNPPPNPTKITDPRAADYIARYGESSWEVDALNPSILNRILEEGIMSLIDVDEYWNVMGIEKRDRETLEEIARVVKTI